MPSFMNNTDKPDDQDTGSKTGSDHSLRSGANETRPGSRLPSFPSRVGGSSQPQTTRGGQDESGKSKRDRSRSPSPFRLDSPSDELSLRSMRISEQPLSFFNQLKKNKTGEPHNSLGQDNDYSDGDFPLTISPLESK
jgi:hypothetical protein